MTVAYPPYDPRHPDCPCKESAELMTYWESLRIEGKIPFRRDLQPVKIKHLLPVIAMFDVEEDGTGHFRLAGTEIVSRRAEGDPRGQTMANYLAPDMEEPLRLIGHHMMNTPCGFVMHAKNVFDHDYWNISYSLFLPLADQEGIIRHTIGMMTILENPFRYAVKANEHQSLDLIAAGFIDLGFGVPEE